ncbi:MAG: hypothetical protein HQK75_11920, partial [Candidatus Magnetomorum sp.]|nr:hypothetical protein [Candidatus Magnetomorum sp.]
MKYLFVNRYLCVPILIICIYLFPSQINASNLTTMGSFDVRQLNAQKISLLSVSGTALDVSGHSLLSGNLDVTGTLTAGSFDISSIVLTDGTPLTYPLDVSGNTRLYQPNSSSGHALSVTGETYMEGNVDVSGTTHLIPKYSWENALDVSGNSLMSGNLNVTGTLTAGSFDVTVLDLTSLEVTNGMPLTYPLDVSGNTRLYQPNSSSGHALSVTGETYMEGNVDVSGTTHLIPKYSWENALDVSGNSLMSGNLNVTGTLTAGSFDVTVLDLTSLEVTNGIPFTYPLDVSGNTRLYQPNSSSGHALSVTGETYMEGNVDVSGTTHLIPKYSWENALDVSGNSLMSGNLNVTGTLTAGSFDVTLLDLTSLEVTN